MNCVEYGNIEPGYEREISGVILGQMKQGYIDVARLPIALFTNTIAIIDWQYVTEKFNLYDCQQAVMKIVEEKDLTLVLDKFVVLIGGIDITQDVIQKLSGE